MADIIFKPVRGSEASILAQSIQDGAFYIANDTGKIFVDIVDQRYLLNSGVNIYYINEENLNCRINVLDVFTYNNTQPSMLFQINDLICNKKDHCIYSIVGMEDDQLILEKFSNTGNEEEPVIVPIYENGDEVRY